MPESLFLLRAGRKETNSLVNRGKLTGQGPVPPWQTLNMRLPTENRGQAAERSGFTCTGESSTGQGTGSALLCVTNEEAYF